VFIRATSIPPVMSLSSIDSMQQAGPIVQIILVLRKITPNI
jgi:hypothetical protein